MKIKMRIVADDFGYCSNRDQGMTELAEARIIWGASLLVNGHSATQAVKSGTANGDRVRFGLHLNLTEGRPITDRNDVKSLLRQDGEFFGGKFFFREDKTAQHVKEDEVFKEICSQIECFMKITGCVPDYIDGHQHIHVTKLVRSSLVKAMRKYGIFQTRLPNEFVIKECDWIDTARLRFFESVNRDAEDCKQLFLSNSIRFSPFFLGMSLMGSDMSIERIRSSLVKVKERIASRNADSSDCAHIEFMVHPGYPCLKNEGGVGEEPDDFACSSDRELELNLLRSKEFSNMLKELDIELCT